MKKENKLLLAKDNYKLAICGVIIFIFGLMIGMSFSIKKNGSIKGSIFDFFTKASQSNASWSSASWTNASWSSTSWTNASWSSTSWANASSSEIASDNVLYLSKMELKTEEVKVGEKIYLDMRTVGANINSASITFENLNNKDDIFTTSIRFNGNNFSYVVVPKSIQTGNYKITNVLLVGRNSNGNTFTKQYSSNQTGTDIYNYQFLGSVSITNQEVNNEKVSPILLSNLTIEKNVVNTGDKVSIKYATDQEISKLKLKFISQNGEEVTAYAKSLDNNPYFEIPTATNSGVYKLVIATFSNNITTTIYSIENVQGSTFYDFNIALQIENKESKDIYVYNNEELTEKIITDIYNAKNGTTIKLNASSNPIINSELFNAIKMKNKKLVIDYDDNEMIFNGNDITDAKSIDVSVDANIITEDMKVSDYVKEGIILNFASNGNLPGAAFVRIKANENMNRILNNNDIYVYYFNSTLGKFSYVDKIVKKSNYDYYEFNINHTSQYVLVDSELDDSLIVSESDGNKIVHDHKILWILIGISVIVIIFVILIIMKNKMHSLNKKEQNQQKN